MSTSFRPTLRRLEIEWVALWVVLIALGALMVTTQLLDRRTILDREGDRLDDQARVVVENVEHLLDAANSALSGTRANAARHGHEGAQMDADLSLLTSSMPGVRTIAVLDAGGTVVASSKHDLVGRNFSQRDYFQTPKQRADPRRLFVTRPFKASVDGYVIFLTKTLGEANGEFAGTVSATLNPDYFSVILESVLYASDMKVALAHVDGTVFTAVAPHTKLDGDTLSPTLERFGGFAASGRHAARAFFIDAESAEEQLLVMRSIPGRLVQMDHPLILAMVRSTKQVLEQWSERSGYYSLTLLALALSSSGLLVLSQRRRVAAGELATQAQRERDESTERLERVNAALKISEGRLSMALEGSSLALFDWDIRSNRLYRSAHSAALRGEAPQESITTPEESARDVHPEDLPAMLTAVSDTLAGRVDEFNIEYRLRHMNGDWLWVRARGRIVERDARGRPLRLAGTYANINERKLAEDRLRHMAEFDALTDLPNRATFTRHLQDALERARRNGPMALLFLDIDRFKDINDTFGHEAGDTLLKEFARRMRANVRQTDLVARLAGDEFTIVLERVRDAADAASVAAKVVAALREPVQVGGQILTVTCSVGTALPLAGDDAQTLLRRADAALYEAKRRGRDGYVVSEAPALSEARRAGAAPARTLLEAGRPG